VIIKVLDFNWIFDHDNFEKLIELLSSTENDDLFATEQIRIFSDLIWQKYFWAILLKAFLPSIIYHVLVII